MIAASYIRTNGKFRLNVQAERYRVTLQWWMFALAGVLAIVIALLTVGFQVVRTAVAKPVERLKSE